MSEAQRPKQAAKVEQKGPEISVLGATLMIAAFLIAQAIVPKEVSWLRVFLFMALAAASTFAMLRIERRVLVAVNDVVEKLVTPFFLALFLVCAMAPAALVFSASKWLSESAPRWGQGAVLAFSACCLLYLLQQIYLPGGLEKFFVRFRKQGLLAPFVIAVNLLFACIGLFSTFVLVLPGNDTFFIANAHPYAHPNHDEVSNFFLWHFFDMVPLFDLNETLQWDAPLEYERKAVGWILVLFKFVVGFPVIWLIAAYYKDRDTEVPAAKPGA